MSVEDLLLREGRELPTAEGWSTRTVVLVAGVALFCGSLLADGPPSIDVPGGGDRVAAAPEPAARQPDTAIAHPDRLTTAVPDAAPDAAAAAATTTTAPPPAGGEARDDAPAAGGGSRTYREPSGVRQPADNPWSVLDPGWGWYRPQSDGSVTDDTRTSEPDEPDQPGDGPDEGSDHPAPGGGAEPGDRDDQDGAEDDAGRPADGDAGSGDPGSGSDDDPDSGSSRERTDSGDYAEDGSREAHPRETSDTPSDNG